MPTGLGPRETIVTRRRASPRRSTGMRGMTVSRKKASPTPVMQMTMSNSFASSRSTKRKAVSSSSSARSLTDGATNGIPPSRTMRFSISFALRLSRLRTRNPAKDMNERFTPLIRVLREQVGECLAGAFRVLFQEASGSQVPDTDPQLPLRRDGPGRVPIDLAADAAGGIAREWFDGRRPGDVVERIPSAVEPELAIVRIQLETLVRLEIDSNASHVHVLPADRVGDTVEEMIGRQQLVESAMRAGARIRITGSVAVLGRKVRRPIALSR